MQQAGGGASESSSRCCEDGPKTLTLILNLLKVTNKYGCVADSSIKVFNAESGSIKLSYI